MGWASQYPGDGRIQEAVELASAKRSQPRQRGGSEGQAKQGSMKRTCHEMRSRAERFLDRIRTRQDGRASEDPRVGHSYRSDQERGLGKTSEVLGCLARAARRRRINGRKRGGPRSRRYVDRDAVTRSAGRADRPTLRCTHDARAAFSPETRARIEARHPRPLGGDTARSDRSAAQISLTGMVLNNTTEAQQLRLGRKPEWIRARVPGGEGLPAIEGDRGHPPAAHRVSGSVVPEPR